MSSDWAPLRCAVQPNMTWIQPPGYVHAMIASTWQPNGLAVTPRVPYNSPNETVGASAQGSADGKTIAVRITNMDKATAAKVEVVVPGFSGGSSKPAVWTLQSVGADGKVDADGANSPGDPTMISPKKAAAEEVEVGAGASGGDMVTVPPFAYVVVEYGGASSEGQ